MAGGSRASADERLATELAAGKTVRDAAGTVGLGESTVYRRLADPAFKARVSEIRSLMVSTAAGVLADGMAEASQVLRKLLAHKDPNVRRLAAAKMIELGLKVAEVAALEQRLAALESVLKPAQQTKRP